MIDEGNNYRRNIDDFYTPNDRYYASVDVTSPTTQEYIKIILFYIFFNVRETMTGVPEVDGGIAFGNISCTSNIVCILMSGGTTVHE